MIVDLVIGLILSAIGFYFGFGFDSVIILFFAFVLDFDIPLNEFIRIFIKKEKKFNLSTVLDEKSYTHKFLFHLPLIVLPFSFLVGMFYQNWLFGVLLALAILLHLIHDTTDKNFDGVSWLWPFNKNSYKLKRTGWETKTRQMLAREAEKKKERSTSQILRDNKT